MRIKRGDQSSYREPKVLNVLEFYDFIRVPLNVLEFVLNVLEFVLNVLEFVLNVLEFVRNVLECS